MESIQWGYFLSSHFFYILILLIQFGNMLGKDSYAGGYIRGRGRGRGGRGWGRGYGRYEYDQGYDNYQRGYGEFDYNQGGYGYNQGIFVLGFIRCKNVVFVFFN